MAIAINVSVEEKLIGYELCYVCQGRDRDTWPVA